MRNTFVNCLCFILYSMKYSLSHISLSGYMTIQIHLGQLTFFWGKKIGKFIKFIKHISNYFANIPAPLNERISYTFHNTFRLIPRYPYILDLKLLETKLRRIVFPSLVETPPRSSRKPRPNTEVSLLS